ncbi:MAG: hypothetical protein ACRDYA_09955 [Egibacteraceae bacterium]
MTKDTKSPQAVLTQAGYAALGAGDAAFECARKLSEQLPGRIRAARERLPDIFAHLVDRGRRLAGQVAEQNGDAPKPPEPEAATGGDEKTE